MPLIGCIVVGKREYTTHQLISDLESLELISSLIYSRFNSNVLLGKESLPYNQRTQKFHSTFFQASLLLEGIRRIDAQIDFVLKLRSDLIIVDKQRLKSSLLSFLQLVDRGQATSLLLEEGSHNSSVTRDYYQYSDFAFILKREHLERSLSDLVSSMKNKDYGNLANLSGRSVSFSGLSLFPVNVEQEFWEAVIRENVHIKKEVLYYRGKALTWKEKCQIKYFERQALMLSAETMGIGLPTRLSGPQLWHLSMRLVFVTFAQYSKSIVKVLLAIIKILSLNVESRKCRIEAVQISSFK